MRALFRKCPKCGSKDIKNGTVKTHYTLYNSSGVVERWQEDACDAGTTECLICHYEESP